MKLNILIPFKDTEEYINQCIISILNSLEYTFSMNSQLEGCKILLLNDHSTDNSVKVINESYCERFAYMVSAKDKIRYEVINHKGMGMASVRNTLLNISRNQCDVILFIDSDDWVSETYIYNHIRQFHKYPDIQYTQAINTTKFIDNKYLREEHLGLSPHFCEDITKLIPYISDLNNGIFPVLWTKMIKVEYLDNGTLFNYDQMEDAFFTFTHFQKVKKVAFFEDEKGGVFRRYMRPKSLQSELKSNNNWIEYAELLIAILNYFIKNNFPPNMFLPVQFLKIAISTDDSQSKLFVKDFLNNNVKYYKMYINNKYTKNVLLELSNKLEVNNRVVNEINGVVL
jgi:hypothetical protein